MFGRNKKQIAVDREGVFTDSRFQLSKHQTVAFRILCFILFFRIFLASIDATRTGWVSIYIGIPSMILFAYIAIHPIYVLFVKRKLIRFIAFSQGNMVVSPYIGRDFSVSIDDIISIEPIKKASRLWRDLMFERKKHYKNRDSGYILKIRNRRPYIIGPNMEDYERCIELLKGEKRFSNETAFPEPNAALMKIYKDSELYVKSKHAYVHTLYRDTFIAMLAASPIGYGVYGIFSAIYPNIVISDATKAVLMILFFVMIAIHFNWSLNRKPKIIQELLFNLSDVEITLNDATKRTIENTLIDSIEDNDGKATEIFFRRTKSEKKFKDYGFYLKLKDGTRYSITQTMHDLKDLRRRFAYIIETNKAYRDNMAGSELEHLGAEVDTLK